MTSHYIKLVRTRRGCAICERTDRFDVVVGGRTVEQLYFNMTGYVGTLPLPGGGPALCIGERGIGAYRREVARINRAAKAVSGGLESPAEVKS